MFDYFLYSLVQLAFLDKQMSLGNLASGYGLKDFHNLKLLHASLSLLKFLLF